MDAIDAKIADVDARILREKMCKEGAENMLRSLTDKSAHEVAQNEVYESQRRLDYLQSQKNRLIVKKKRMLNEPIPPELVEDMQAFTPNPNTSYMAGTSVAISSASSFLDNVETYAPLNPPDANSLNHYPGRPVSESDPWNGVPGSMPGSSALQGGASYAPYHLSNAGPLPHSNSFPATSSHHQPHHSSLSNPPLPSSSSAGSSTLPTTASYNSSFTSAPQKDQRQSVIGNLLSQFGVRKVSGSGTPNRSTSSSTTSLSSLLTGDQSAGGFRIARTHFDFWKTDTAITNDKVNYKLQEVKFKLDMEQKVKAGTERMYATLKAASGNPSGATSMVSGAVGAVQTAVMVDMDKKRQEEVGEKLAECNAKVALLTKAFQRYKSIWVADDEEENDDAGESTDATTDDEAVENRVPATPPTTKRPSGPSTANPLPSPVLSTKFSANSKRLYSGKLKIRLVTATNLPNRKSTSGQLYGVIRVDGVQKAKTRPTTRKWNEEFDISVDKAQEVEISVYEKGGNNVLALMWFKLWELEEELQLRTRGSLVALGSQTPEMGLSSGDLSLAAGNNGGGSQMSIGGGEEAYVQNLSSAANGFVDGVEAKLELEPSGQLLLRANFVADTPKLRRAKQGVFRRPPVQKALPKRGHKFVPQQFYQVMKCAVCQEFLLSGAGYQCQLCKYTCHKRCMPRVINKCISKTEQEQDEEEGEPTTPAYAQILNHRIPHRFEPTSNIGAAWCCHCGYMLPVGKKQSLKCGECGLSSHKECMPLVPTLCGMSAEMMDQMKLALEDAERAKRDKESGASPAAKRQQQGNQRRQTQSARPMSLATSDTSLASAGGSSPLLPPQAVPSTPQQQIQVPQKQVGAPVSPQPVVSSVQLPPQVPPQQQQQQVVPHPRPQKGIGLDDFNFLAVLGKGNFGKVMLAEEKYSKHLYAIKVLKKEFIIENDEVESTRSEKRVFLTANRERHPFLVNLHSCFQTESRIYFVMEYVSGGDLMWHIQHQQFSEKRAKFYACEVLLALEYFHKNNVVYRDLKLDNILLSLEGHIKIADYGLCKEGMTYGATTNTFCGTPEFMAPEILLEKPYTRAVDWWALGVLIYEMLLGQSPFRGDDEDEIFEAILKDEILYPVNMAKDAVTLLQKLLTKDPAKRLGSGRGDAEDIKRHPFFKGVDWDAMLKLQIAPPYKPKISSPTDVSCFDEEFTREMPVLTPCHSVLSAADQEEFRGFTYISEWAQQKRQEALAGGSSSRVPGS